MCICMYVYIYIYIYTYIYIYIYTSIHTLHIQTHRDPGGALPAEQPAAAAGA